jgi:hypothetical protein
MNSENAHEEGGTGEDRALPTNPDELKAFMPQTLGEMQSFIDTPVGRDLYLKDPDKYENSVLEAEKNAADSPQGKQPADLQPGNQPPAAPQAPAGGEPAAPSQPTETGEVIKLTAEGGEVLEIPKDMLGTYIKGRGVGEGLMEALKGLGEKDKVIDFFKNKDLENQNQMGSLKARIAQYVANNPQPAASPAAPAGAEVVEDVEVPTIDMTAIKNFAEDPDSILDSENRKALLDSVMQLADAQNKTVQLIKNRDQKAAQQSQQATAEQLRKDARINEFREIDTMVNSHPELKLSKPFAELDNDIHNWMRQVHYLNTGSSTWDQKALDSVRTYYADTPEGEALRSKCAAANQSPPEDIEKHSTIMHVRSLRNAAINKMRNDLAVKTGREPETIEDHELPSLPFTYSDFYDRERQSNPSVMDEMLKQRIEGVKAVTSQAGIAGSDVAAEIPPEQGGAPTITLENVSVEQMSKLLNTDHKKYSEEEAGLVYDWYAASQIPMPAGLKQRVETSRAKTPT